jgi:hypothetical protein
MSKIVDTIKNAPTTIYHFATGSYHGVPVMTFVLIGMTSIALAYVTLTQDDEPNAANRSEDNEGRMDNTDEDDQDETQEYKPEQPQMVGGKKKQSIKKGGKKNKKTIKKAKK